MVSATTVFLALTVVPVLGFWVAMLVLRVGPAGTSWQGGTGAAWLDVQSAFDSARWRHIRWRALMRVAARGRDVPLPVLPAGATAGLRFHDRRTVPLSRVVGSVDGGRHPFDRHFDPTSDDAWARFSSVMRARVADVSLPPVLLVEVAAGYYVLDGHHRVAVARALGDTTIEAEVARLDGHGTG